MAHYCTLHLGVCMGKDNVPQVVVDLPPQLVDSEQNILKVGSRVWLKDKDLYGFVRYVLYHLCL